MEEEYCCDDSEARPKCFEVRQPDTEIDACDEPCDPDPILLDCKRKRGSEPHDCVSCHRHILKLEQHIQLLNAQLESKMHDIVQSHVEDMQAKMQSSIEAAVANSRPPKKMKKNSRLPNRCCFICGGNDGPVLNRQLGVVLDDRCRKQMDVIKHGGKLTERRDMWERAIVHLNCPTAALLAQKLGVKLIDPQCNFNVQACNERIAGQICTVCQEPMVLGSRVQTLECSSRHIFHHECITSWLQTNKTCPNCREDVKPPGSTPHQPVECCKFQRTGSGDSGLLALALLDGSDLDLMDLLGGNDQDPAACARLFDTWEVPSSTGGSTHTTNSSSSMDINTIDLTTVPMVTPQCVRDVADMQALQATGLIRQSC